LDVSRVAAFRELLWGRVRGAYTLSYTPGDAASRNAHLAWIWRRPDVRQLASEVDGLPEALHTVGARDRAHRPSVYDPSVKLFIHMVASVLGIPLAQAYGIVRLDPTLRKLAGASPPTSRARRKLAALCGKSRERIDGDPFPCYETVRAFPKWWAKAERLMLKAHNPELADDELERADPFWRLRHLVHRELPGAAAVEFGVEHSLLAVDGAGIASPLRRKRRTRGDGTAKQLRKRDKTWYGRTRITVLSGPLGMVIDSDLVIASEVEAMATRAVPRVRANLDAINNTCHETGVHATTIERPIWYGDGGFNTTGCMKALHDHNFDGLFRNDHDGIRLVTGARKLPLASGNLTIEYKVCNDGAYLCPCQWQQLPKACWETRPMTDEERAHLARLEPMEQLAGRSGEYVMMRCTAPTCPRFYRQVRVPYPKLEEGSTDLVSINQVVRWDVQNRANQFMGTEAIERLNAALTPRDRGTRRDATPSLTGQLGDDAANLGSLLADLRINAQILRNLELERVTLTTLDVYSAVKNAYRKAMHARRLTKPDGPFAPQPVYHLMNGAAKRLQSGRPPTPIGLAGQQALAA
jgi:hypothetical protein